MLTPGRVVPREPTRAALGLRDGPNRPHAAAAGMADHARRFRVELRPGGEPIGRPDATAERAARLRRWVVALPLLAIALAILGSGHAVGAAKGAAARTQGATASLLSDASDGWTRIARRGAVLESLHDLEREHARLRLEVLRLQAVEREHARLLTLTGLAERAELHGVMARVIARQRAGRDILRLDQGTDAGIEVGRAVVAGTGIVGQVVDAGAGWSEVLAVTDPTHGLAASVGADNGHGLVQGTGGAMELWHVPARARVAPGDVVVATGEGGVFPADVPLGTVRSLELDADGVFLRIVVDPLASVDTLDEVLVVTP